MAKDNSFQITLENFHVGAAPVAHINPLTELGNAGHYSVAVNVDILDPTGLTQGPGLADLTNGTQAGAVSELINFILDQPPSDSVTYGIGPTKLFKITPTAVTNDGTFPHTITNATDGESVIEFQGALYYFFNKSSGGDIGKYDLSASFTDNWGSSTPTGAAALQKAPHPSAKKEDILLFGNGRYAGTYVSSTTTLAPTKLDFGANSEVADVLFHANQWHIAVNSGVTTGTNRASAQIYFYDAGAVTSILSDEAAVGVQQIGFLQVIGGLVYVAWKDISGYNLFGYLSGRRLMPVGYFSGNLPTYEKKTSYKVGLTLFESSGLLYAVGAITPDQPIALSQHADGGYATCGAVAAPFGTPMVSSTDGGSNFRLAKFSGYDTACSWKSVVAALGGAKGTPTEVIVLTNALGVGASCALTIEANQAQNVSQTMTITTAGKTRHKFTSIGLVSIEDLRAALDFSGGSASNPVRIRKIIIRGEITEQ